MQRREFLAGGAGAGLLLAAPRLSWAGSAAQAGMAAGATGTAAAAVPTLTLAVDPGLLCLDEGWRFHEGDIPFPPISGQDASYDNAKAGKAWGAAAGDFDDSQWRQLRLPHDFAIEQPIEASANVAQGYRRRGIAWYRRSLRLDEAQRGKALELRFDGISSRATVWVNGLLMARSWSGYDGFAIDLSAIARYGQDLNSIAVRVDAEAMDGWWYEGAGIYRHTWLAVRDALHIVGDGVHAVPRIGSDAQWTLPVAVTLANTGEQVDAAALEVALYDAHGTLVAQGSTAVQVGALAQALAQVELQVRQPQRWDVAAPHLYRVVTVLRSAGRERDRRECAIGFRTLRFDAQHGFFLNERPLKIKGACLHQDHAGVGVAVPDSLLEFRIRRLKALGCNAIRLHHAVASELLDVCDRLGMLVMAENRVFNPAPDYAAQLRWLVRRDRNHACVFLWSVFNEEPMQGTVAGYEMVRRAVALVRELDDSRPVTAAMNDGMLTQRNAADAVDVVGFNYRQFNYDRVRAAMPHKPLLSSEDTSAFQTRGAWCTDMAAHVIAEDDSVAAPWGNTHRTSWKLIEERPYLAGGFVWTGFDYRGEPTPFEWPSVSSFFGIMDLCGFPKGAYWLRQAQWIDDAPVLQLLPHWNWPGREGTPIKVMAFCNAQQVELWLNGQSQGRQAVDRIEMNAWQVTYAPGVLEAVAYRDGREVARQRVQTVGAPVALRLTADRARMRGDGRDAQPITLEAVDA
ncbi:beta-galactosidase GalA, partial [Xanthomonas graminis]